MQCILHIQNISKMKKGKRMKKRKNSKITFINKLINILQKLYGFINIKIGIFLQIPYRFF